MEWLIAVVALIAGLIIGWWLANRAFESRDGGAAPAGQSPEPIHSPAAAPAPLEDDPDPDDLTKIEGVGPKIAELLNMGGIYTFEELAATPVSHIRDMLVAAGERFKVHDPQTWPQQAELAAAAKWQELEMLQDQLEGGRAT